MVQDLHSHTYYSNCGADEPVLLVEKAIESGIELFGITDHNYGIGRRKPEYFNTLTELRDRYKDRIRLLRGIEIATVNNLCITPDEDISYFDYCLIEHIDIPNSCVGGMGIFDFVKRCGCRAGIAHTDLFSYLKMMEIDPLGYFTRLAEQGIFWEMNMSYDSIHAYREHAYVKDFMKSEYQQDIIRRSGIRISVGFDSHRLAEYREDRVKDMCAFIESIGIALYDPSVK